MRSENPAAILFVAHHAENILGIAFGYTQGLLINAGVVRNPPVRSGFKPMNEGPEHRDEKDERRARAIEQLVEKAAASPDPTGWVRDFMLRALRTPSLVSLPTADRADARREINAIGRAVSGALSRRPARHVE